MAIYKDLRYFTGSTVGTAATGASQVLLKKVTASSGDANITFDSSFITSDFKEYIFTFISMHPASDNVFLSFNASADNGSNYNVTKTTTFWRAQNKEDDSGGSVAYDDGSDSAQQTGFQVLENGNSSDNDHASSGYLHLYNPSSTTFQKLYYSRMSSTSAGDFNIHSNTGGAFNSTSAINNVRFQFSSGNIDSGTIKLYGVN
tara:strand:+ start:106 stop:711 length:606 start_codon:yes stop_codon:yes gene_type:complete